MAKWQSQMLLKSYRKILSRGRFMAQMPFRM